MATEAKEVVVPTDATNGKSDARDDGKVIADHHITLKASLQNAQAEKQKAMESFHQWAGAEAILQGLLAEYEKHLGG